MLRRLLLLCLLIAAAPAASWGAAAFPVLTGRVVDDAHILKPDTVQQLDAMLSHHEQGTGEQIVVVTIPSLNGQVIEEYGYSLGRAWGIGQKGKNNGALIIVAPNEREARIEAGYGLEGRLTDAASTLIINRIMLPAFRAGDYDTGILNAARTVIAELGGAETGILPADAHGEEEPLSPLMIALIILVLFMLMRSRRGGLAPFILGTMLGSSGGSGGGGGGFRGGGGGFGGGGASGRW